MSKTMMKAVKNESLLRVPSIMIPFIALLENASKCLMLDRQFLFLLPNN